MSSDREHCRVLQIVVLDKKLLTDPELQYISGDNLATDRKRWKDIHRKLLRLPSGASARPSRCVCGLHAKRAIAHAETNGWVSPGQFTVPDAAWASDDWDGSLMDHFLVDSVTLAAADQQA